jgi:hypothetical protein
MRAVLLTLALLIAALVLVTMVAVVWMTRMPGRSHRGPLPPLTAEETALGERLREHVTVLAGQIGERNMGRYESLQLAEQYVADAFDAVSVTVERHPFTAAGHEVANLIVTLPGKTHPEEMIVVGAHYDTVPGSPGADDNATGVAALIELARALRETPMERTVQLVAFVNEEAPWFGTDAMGSLVHARRTRALTRTVTLMLSLEMLGYFRDEPGTQHYPPPLSRFYPDRGDFIAFVGRLRDGDHVRRCARIFRDLATVPAEGGALPSVLPDIGRSDHWAFWQTGVPALMVTDTANFRNPAYHGPGDTPETIDYDRLARVTAGLAATVEELAGRTR